MAGVIRGHLIPSAASVRNVVKAIRKEAAANPSVKRALRKDPRAFLGSRGLPVDSQRELLRDEGFKGKWYNDCTVTCVATNCCCTACCWSCQLTAW